MLVREYRVGDFPRLQEMIASLDELTRTLELPARAEVANNTEKYAAEIAGDHEQGRCKIFVLERGAAVSGFVTCRVDESSESVTNAQLGRRLLVKEIYLEPKLRGLGVGQGLLQAAIVYARNVGATCVLIDIPEKNVLAKAACTNAGFEIYAHRLIRGL